MISRYWSCSKFADWVRGTSKPHAETGSGWTKWSKAAAAAHPVRYWLAEEGLDYLQRAIQWPTEKLGNVRYYINNRWVSKSHALTAHPRDIKPGSWCDVGNRFLPCLFNELVDFVEVEQAWHHCMWDEEAREKYKTPWWRSGWLRWRSWRCPEAGLDYLRWASNLVLDGDWVDQTDPDYGKPTHQALAAREILELYNWWKNIRPMRMDPHDASGWTELCEKRRAEGRDLLDLEERSEEEAKAIREALDKCNKYEEQHFDEDTEMLIRLIKVRRSLWT